MVDRVFEVAGFEGDGAEDGGLGSWGGYGVGGEGLEDVGDGLGCGAALGGIEGSGTGVGGWGYGL